ncbi:hypothetical protein Taro_021872 [Colocasia esculenta]|uniref:Uncharacterized protein n=1 Tax=Colocasia esculenta TaxID=4460 RepID=A0A843UZZ8_COLES|nr:hypothetical protein [Colocasia esculenta]
MLLQGSHSNSHNRIDENWSSEDTRRAEEGDELFSPPKGTFWGLQEFVGSLDAVLGTRSSVDLLSYCVDLLSHSANRLFWDLIQCRPALVVVSTCCPNSENMLFWERGLVSTCPHPVSTWDRFLRRLGVGDMDVGAPPEV